MAESKFPYRIIDLTHALDVSAPTWSGGCEFNLDTLVDYPDCETEVKFRVQCLKMNAGIGTHIDAPAHCFPHGSTISDLALEQLAVPCVSIDVSDKSHELYSLMPEDIMSFEAQYGLIPTNSLVIVYTGWDKYWNEPTKYHNQHVFPSVSSQAAQLLLERGIAGLGIDTLSPDRPNEGYEVHRLLLGANKYIIENVANASALPPIGSYCLALPLKIVEGTESPIRLIALVHKKSQP